MNREIKLPRFEIETRIVPWKYQVGETGPQIFVPPRMSLWQRITNRLRAVFHF